MPARCTDYSTAMYVILLLVVVVLLVAIVGTVLFCKYRKLKAGVLATMKEDDVMKIGVSCDCANHSIKIYFVFAPESDLWH